jgi:hypothetical protein
MAQQAEQIKLAFDTEYLAELAIMITKETVRNHGNAALVVEPYTDEVKVLIKIGLTHSERKAAGLVAPGAQDPRQLALKAMVARREAERFGLAYDVDAALGDSCAANAWYQKLTA